jgi:hypothetical protein
MKENVFFKKAKIFKTILVLNCHFVLKLDINYYFYFYSILILIKLNINL